MRCVFHACPLAVSSDCANVSPEAGSGSCEARPACTNSDYFYTHTPCDSRGQVLSSNTVRPAWVVTGRVWITIWITFAYSILSVI